MPKMIKISLFIILTLASLLLVVSCGSDNGGAAPRVNPIDMVTTGSTNVNTSGTSTLGGGGGGTGSCVVSVSGAVLGCYGGIDQSTCNAFAAGGGTVNFTAGQTCQNLGYLSCQPVGPYLLCQ